MARLGGKALAAELREWVHQRGELDVLTALARVGIEPEPENLTLATELGVRVSEGPVTGVQVKAVLAGGAGAAAGLSAGDEILAVDGWRVRRLDDALAWIRTGAAFELLVVRQQRVRTLRVADRTPAQRGDAAVARPAPEREPERRHPGPPQRLAGKVVLSPWRESRRRRAAWFALILAVVLAHALLALRVLSSVIGWNSAAQPRRIEITFDRRLAPSEPPTAVAVAAAPAPAARARARVPRAVRAPRASSAPAPRARPSEIAAAVPLARRAARLARASWCAARWRWPSSWSARSRRPRPRPPRRPRRNAPSQIAADGRGGRLAASEAARATSRRWPAPRASR